MPKPKKKKKMFQKFRLEGPIDRRVRSGAARQTPSFCEIGSSPADTVLPNGTARVRLEHVENTRQEYACRPTRIYARTHTQACDSEHTARGITQPLGHTQPRPLTETRGHIKTREHTQTHGHTQAREHTRTQTRTQTRALTGTRAHSDTNTHPVT